MKIIPPLLILVISASLFLFSGPAESASDELPDGGLVDVFRVGQRVENNWIVSGVVTHPEFMRLNFTRGDEKTTIEIVRNTSGAGEWTSEHYRVQPAPDANPSELLLKSVLGSIESYESTHAPTPFVNEPEKIDPASEWLGFSWVSPELRMWLWVGFVLFLSASIVQVIAFFIRRNRKFRTVWNRISVVLTLGVGLAFALLNSVVSALKPTDFSGELSRKLTVSDIVKALAIVGAAAFIFWLWDARVTQGLDIIRDLLLARDCLDGPRCHSIGAQSSFLFLVQGAVWTYCLVAFLWLGFSIDQLFGLILALHALSFGALYLFVNRVLGKGFGFVAVLIYLLLTVVAVSYPWLFNDSILALPMVVLFVLFAQILVSARLWQVLMASILLAICIDTHLVFILLIPALIVITASSGQASIRNSVIALVVMFITMGVVSFESHYANVVGLLERELLVPIVLGLFALIVVGTRLKVHNESLVPRDRVIFWMVLIAVMFATVITTMGIVFEKSMEPHYHLPGMVAYAFVGSLITFRLISYALTRVKIIKRKVFWTKTVATIVWLAVIALAYHMGLFLEQLDESDKMTMDEQKTVAEYLYAKGYSYDDLAANLRGLYHYEMISGFGVYEPMELRNKRSLDKSLYILKLQRGDFPHQGIRLPERYEVVPLEDDSIALILTMRSSLVLSDMELCYRFVGSSRPGACRNVTYRPEGKKNPQSAPLYAYRAYPELIELPDALYPFYHYNGVENVAVTFSIPMFVQEDDPDKYLFGFTDWWIIGLEGIDFEGEFPAREVLIKGGRNRRGRIILQRILGPQQLHMLRPTIPSLMEVPAEDTEVVDIVRYSCEGNGDEMLGSDVE